MSRFDPLPPSKFTEAAVKYINDDLYKSDMSLERLLDTGHNLQWGFKCFNGSSTAEAFVYVVDKDGVPTTEIGEKKPMLSFQTPLGIAAGVYLSAKYLTRKPDKVEGAKQSVYFDEETTSVEYQRAARVQKYVSHFCNEGFVEAMIKNLDKHRIAPEIKRKPYSLEEKQVLIDKYIGKVHDQDINKWTYWRPFPHKIFQTQKKDDAASITDADRELLDKLPSENAALLENAMIASAAKKKKKKLNPIDVELLDKSKVAFEDQDKIQKGATVSVVFSFYGAFVHTDDGVEKSIARLCYMTKLCVFNNAVNTYAGSSVSTPNYLSVFQPEKRDYSEVLGVPPKKEEQNTDPSQSPQKKMKC